MTARALAILLGALALSLAGCSRIRLVYDYADNYFVGVVQDYFDPTPEQLRAVRSKAEELLAWHRQHELPSYATMFGQAAQKVSDGLSEDEVQWGVAQLRLRYDTLAQRIVEANAPLLTDLSSQNLAALERKFSAENSKLERVYLADAERHAGKGADEQRAERVQKQLERWVGTLSAQQHAIVAAWVAAAPSAAIDWYRERVNRQQSMLSALRSEHDPTVLAARLTALWLGRDAAAPRREHNEARVVALVLSIDQTLSPAQRARAVERMQQYAEDFRALLSEN